MKPRTNSDRASREGPSRNGRPSNDTSTFWEDTRGISSQYDLIFALLILTAAFSVFIAAGTSFIFNTAGAQTSNHYVADRAADRLADDYLVDSPNAAILNRTCTKSFFEESAPGGCGFEPGWSNTDADSPEHYLNNALAVDPAKQVNVTLRTTGGSIESLDGTQLALGESVPDDYGTVYSFHRQVGLDKNNDGAPEWYTLVVEVW
jgi:hypothetical protein